MAHDTCVRALTRPDLETWYGHSVDVTFTGVVVEEAGAVIGFGGYCYESNYVKVFMEVHPGWKVSPKVMLRAVKPMLEAAKNKHPVLYAIAENEEVAPGFLLHFGFEKLYDSEQGSVYRWHS